MNSTPTALEPGLYLVSTPIGSARDITLRALDILAAADWLAAEDTRSLRKLLQIHGIALGERPCIAYHDHTRPAERARLVAAVTGGRSLAYASEAGTPLIADPGFVLARDVAAAGARVTAAPGPCAAIAGLSLCGLPTDRFLFLGFLPTKSAARRSALAEAARSAVTVVLYESPRRLAALLADVAGVFGADHPVVLARELTKRFEEIRHAGASDLAAALEAAPVKGECVVLLAPLAPPAASDDAISEALAIALKGASVRDAAHEVADRLGAKRRHVYQMALQMTDKGSEA